MNLCKGCQDFNGSRFDPKHVEDIVVHNNITELCDCANTVCDLCKFIRREIFYIQTPPDWKYAYSFRDLKDVKGDIRVKWSHDSSKRRWKFYLGEDLIKEVSGDGWEERPMSRRLSVRSPEIGQLLSLSSQWLETCLTKHRKCGPHTEHPTAFIPTRLVDVGQPGQHSVQLVISKNLRETEGLQYATLSYCWGKANSSACTTQNNLKDRLASFSVSSLPKTIQDAIEITRALSIGYLWVDAICIVQGADEDKDWKYEFPHVGKIYQSSIITIAASGAEDSSEGCFYRRVESQWPIQDYHLFDQTRPRSGDNPILLRPKVPDSISVVDRSPLEKRGWAMQERLLSPRKLFCTQEGFFWECMEARASEYMIMTQHQETSFAHSAAIGDLAWSLREGSCTRPCHAPGHAHMFWTDFLEDFSEKGLTKVTDKLAAVEGLGTELSGLTGRQYSMGVWKHNLIQEMAWMLNLPRSRQLDTPSTGVLPRARIPKVPSWSWASIDHAMLFAPVTEFYEHKERFPPRTIFYEFYDCKELATILSIDSERLLVHSRLETVLVGPAQKDKYPEPVPACVLQPVTPWSKSERGKKYNSDEFAIMDTLVDSISEERKIECLVWMKWTNRRVCDSDDKGVECTGALIVSLVDEKEKVYRRLGWVVLAEAELSSNEDKTFVLI